VVALTEGSTRDDSVTVAPTGQGHANCQWRVANAYTASNNKLDAQATIDTAAHGNWYDVTVTAECGAETLVRRYMGHLENGKTSTTDPLMGAPSMDTTPTHPDIPEYFRNIEPWREEKVCEKRRSRHKDECWDYVHRHEEL